MNNNIPVSIYLAKRQFIVLVVNQDMSLPKDLSVDSIIDKNNRLLNYNIY